MRLITLEEHYMSPALKDSEQARRFQGSMGYGPDSPMARRLRKLDEIGDQRIAEMDAGGIDV